MFMDKQEESTTQMEELKTSDIQMKKKTSTSSRKSNSINGSANKERHSDSDVNKENENGQWVDVLEKSMSTRVFSINDNNDLFEDVKKLANTSRN